MSLGCILLIPIYPIFYLLKGDYTPSFFTRLVVRSSEEPAPSSTLEDGCGSFPKGLGLSARG